MRRIYRRPHLKVRALASSYVRPTQSPRGGIDNLTSLPSRRHESSLAQDVKTAISSWTQHTLPNSQVFSTEPIELTRAEAEPHLAYIAFGSNMGNRIDWIEQACNEMTNAGIKILRTSSLWETEPMYVPDQDKFANGVCEVSFQPPFHTRDTKDSMNHGLQLQSIDMSFSNRSDHYDRFKLYLGQSSF